MSDDITFCFNSKCKNTGCERNPANIKVPYRDHSFAFFQECEMDGNRIIAWMPLPEPPKEEPQ